MQSQLKDSESELSDTEYDRYISDQQDMLDNLYSEYSKLVEDVMADHDRLLKEALDLFAQTGTDVQETIRNTAEEYGYEMTGEMEKIISSIESMGHLDSYLGVGGTITQSLGDIVNAVHNTYTGLSSDILSMKDAVSSIGFQGKYDTSDTDHTDNNVYENTSGTGDSNITNNTNVTVNTDKSGMDAVNDSITEANKAIGSSGALSSAVGNAVNSPLAGTLLGTGAKKALVTDLLKNGTNEYDPKTTSSLNRYIHEKYGSALTVAEMSTLSKYLGLHYSPDDLATDNPDHQKYKKQILEVLKLQGFSQGGVVQDMSDAVRENKDSVIISAKPGESVFNEKQTRMIQEYVNKTPDLKTLMSMEHVMDRFIQAPDIQPEPRPTSVKVEYDNVNINLPNVENYADFMNKAKVDPQFEKMITCILRHQMGVGSPLKKTSVNFRH